MRKGISIVNHTLALRLTFEGVHRMFPFKIQVLALAVVFGASGCVTQKTFDREHELNQQLQASVDNDNIKIEQLNDRLRITIEDSILYPSGKAELSSEGRKALDKIIPTLKDADGDHRIEVEGYTDDVPVGKGLKAKYKTNWELSSARAASVVEYLQKKGVDPSRLTAAGHGQYQPTADNASTVGRARNRRTDIDLVPVNKGN
jgi:chemotaxis protein MotB